VFAAEWQIDPYMKATSRFDDNIRFSILDSKSSTVGVIELGADLKNESEVVKTKLSPRIHYSGYASDGDLSNDAQFLDFTTRSAGERSTPSLDINLSRDSTLDRIADAGVVSNVLVNEQRNRWKVKPGWHYRFTEQDALDLSLEVDSVSYEDAAGTGLVNYVNQTTKLSYIHSLTEINDFEIRLSQTEYESDPNGAINADKSPKEKVSADTTGVEIGITNEFTNRTKGSFYIGGESTEVLGSANGGVSRDLGPTKNNGLTLKAVLDHKTEADKGSITLFSGVVPSPDGIIRDQDSLQIHFERRMNVKLGWGVDALFQRSESIGREVVEDLNYYYLEPSLTWNLTQAWKLIGTYRLSLRDFDQDTGEADRNELGLSIEYRRPPREELEQLEQPLEQP
jgi:hypothetical protein